MINRSELLTKLGTWRWPFTRRARKPAAPLVLGGYTQQQRRRRYRFIATATLALISLFYGLVVGATGTIFLMQLLLLPAFAAFLVLWLLPETDNPSPKLVEVLFFVYLGGAMLWPDYLAIALPGLPWITMGRITAIPLAIFYISSLSQSRHYRSEIKAVLAEVPVIWKAMAIFAAVAAFSVLVSDKPFASANRLFVAAYAWVMIFFIASHVFRRPGTATIFCYLVWASTIVICIIAVMEVRRQAIPWAGHIPNFLKIEDEAVQRMLSPKVRGSTGVFRAQTKFASPLSMSEFLALSAPFIMHIAAYHKNVVARIAAVCTIPPMIWAIAKTDARLGMIGLMFASLLFILAWAVMRMRQRKDSLLAPVVVLGYPLGFAAFIAASFAIQRLKNIVWGSSAYSDSNQGRIDQVNKGLPMILERPWGYGIGRSGETLGFTNPAGMITIDNYMLSLALELGLIGLAAFVIMFAWAALTGAKEISRTYDFESTLLVPAAITLVNFLIIKTVLSQLENLTLFFAVLGLTVALIYRVREHARRTAGQLPQQAAIAP